jgi:hypothetical protein
MNMEGMSIFQEKPFKTFGIHLSPGTYPIRVDYFQGPKMQIALQLFVTPPGEEERIVDLKDFE